jgi:hypothetical protein
MERERVKKLITRLVMGIVLFGLITPVMGIDHPVEPFQKAKAMALMEGKVIESEKYGKGYILVIRGWGAISYYPRPEVIFLTKGTPSNNSGLCYREGKYSVIRVIDGGKPEITFLDWSVAMDIAYKYLREIEAGSDK